MAHITFDRWDFVAFDGQKPRPDGTAKALQTIMRELGFTDEEFQLLRQAQANSDGLVKTEVIAMKAVKGIVDDDSKKLARSSPATPRKSVEYKRPKHLIPLGDGDFEERSVKPKSLTIQPVLPIFKLCLKPF